MMCAFGMPQLYNIPVLDPVVPPLYNFQYGVSDAETGQHFSHNENRDNDITTGEYRVNLPDGRVQIVTYKADEVS